MDLFEDLVDVPAVVGLWLRPPLLALLAVLGRGGAALAALGRAPADDVPEPVAGPSSGMGGKVETEEEKVQRHRRSLLGDGREG